jgi:hypothetical protein
VLLSGVVRISDMSGRNPAIRRSWPIKPPEIMSRRVGRILGSSGRGCSLARSCPGRSLRLTAGDLMRSHGVDGRPSSW